MRLGASTAACGLILFSFLFQTSLPVMGQSQELIVDICTTPNKYWNKQVLLKGHVVRVTPDPPGTNRGRFTLRDHSDKDIEVYTDDLPAQGKICVVNGVVEHHKPGDTVPAVRETSGFLSEPGAVAGPSEKSAEKPATAAKVRPATRDELAEAVKRELEKQRAEQKGKTEPTQAGTGTIPGGRTASVGGTAAAGSQDRPAADRSIMRNPWVLAGGALVIVAIIAVLAVAMRSKPAPAMHATPPAAAAPVVSPHAPPPPAPAAVPPTMAMPTLAAASGAAIMVMDRGTEVFTRLGGELHIVEGPARGKFISIGKNITLIGRGGRREDDLELSDGTVSREQAKVLYDPMNRNFRLMNESATNTTRVNGVVVDSAVLKDDHRIEFGSTVVRFKRT